MEKSLLIRGGHVIDPATGIDEVTDVLLRNGHIATIAPDRKVAETADEVFNAKGLVVAPGFIDLHVHLREPGQSHKETILTGTQAAAAGGFTSVCAMPNTTPVNDSAEITAWMQAPERRAVVNVFPIAAATKGSRGEELSDYRALRKAGAVAVSDDGKPILDDRRMEEALRLAATVGFPVIQHAEDTRITAGASMNAGPVSFRLGLRGWPNDAESSIVARDIDLARRTRAQLHVAHISTAEALDAISKVRHAGVRVTCEVTPHHFTLTDDKVGEYDTHYKMNPPLRSADDRDAMIKGLLDGTIDCIATDHAPHARHEKEVEFDKAAFGITGMETALGLALTELVHKRKMPLKRLVELLSANPAKIIGLRGRGALEQGGHADLTIFDPKAKWTFDVAKSKSRSRNTPFDGWQFTGRVVATIVGGEMVYRLG
ncbi:MAG TPA: dihydroorotase [Terriglobales bacterium]|nr:dihydroorotase [Terriglobales bacterium]